jgi:hypothetical protein
VAQQAVGWEPSTVLGGSNKKMTWRCEKGHAYEAAVSDRTRESKTGCPVCAGKQTLPGFNDLATLFPLVAQQADGWDPSTVTGKSGKKFQWRCELGHCWVSTVANRTPPHNRGCPVCGGKKALAGFNDLATLFPKIAEEADGWNPSEVVVKSHSKLSWRCKKGHTWLAVVSSRTPPLNCGCPVCSGRQVLPGFTDLATLFPELAKEANGWNPTTVKAKSQKKLSWSCREGHTWLATPANRANGRGCPECAKYGFKKEQSAWFYLLNRPGEQQLGITNEPETRLRYHSRYGWGEVELVGPFPGDQVQALEMKLKRWLRNEVGLVPGTHENWLTARLEVQSLAELKARSGVETDLF